MDLYDDLDTKQRPGQIDGWSSGVKLLQTQLALKKATAATTMPIPQSRMNFLTKPRSTTLAPVMLLKSKKDDIDDIFKADSTKQPKPKVTTTIAQSLTPSSKLFNDYNWDVIDEYDPLWPNEYEKLVKDKRDKETDKNRERLNSRDDSRNDRHDRKRGSNRNSQRFDDNSPPAKFASGFGGRPDDEDNYNRSPPTNTSQSRSGGAAIAPPLSLQESTAIIPSFVNEPKSLGASNAYGAGSVAAKIMAKYGFKDGQGLGKQEQGMSIALQVEKTSKHGGRIIHEKELMLPPPPAAPDSPPMAQPQQPIVVKEEPTITEIMKAPSKVVLLRNMVGPGDVDNELEPEVKDECNTKYGDVISVIINELQNVVPEEAVRIFVEFKRIESAIKAVVDLNGRFFGGRQVRAGFFSFDKYKAYQLYD